MRAKWMWSSWAYLTLSLVVALRLLFIAFSVYFIFPKFSGLLAAGFIDGKFLRKPGGSWMLTFLRRLETVEPQNYRWSILLAAAAAIGLFEWRLQGENKSLMRFSAAGDLGLGLVPGGHRDDGLARGDLLSGGADQPDGPSLGRGAS